MNNLIIRKETENDYKNTEYMTLRAFYNVFGPGCNEHLFVHVLRESDDYLPEFSRVAELDGKIVGLIMFFKASVVDGDVVHTVAGFGPLCVDPLYKNRGIGRALMDETFPLVKEAGYPGIVIFGEPGYYPKYGFKTTSHFGITAPDGSYSDPLMAYPLDEEKFAEIHGRFFETSACEAAEDEEALAKLTAEFPYHEKLSLSCQPLHEFSLGRVAEIQKNQFVISYWGQDIPATVKGSFYNEGLEYPIVGDYVTFRLNPRGDSVITSVCERKSLLKRPDQSGHAISFVKNMNEQNIAANFDYAFIVTSLNGNYNLNRIARYVSITIQGGGIPVVILTKCDLCDNPGRFVREVEALSDKVRVHTVSALYGIGLEELREYLVPGKTTVLIGSSGVGKSTLVNAVMGEEIMKTSEIREEDSKGRHTTTYRRLIELTNGAVLIDTPGMRELGLLDVDEGLEETFEDIRELETRCRFRDCKHESEPGCAVQAALRDGTLSEKRYALYRGLSAENRMHKSMRTIAKKRKQLNKADNRRNLDL